MKVLKAVTSDCPALAIVYPGFYNVLKCYYEKNDAKKDYFNLKKTISHLESEYEKAHEYASSVLLLPDSMNPGRSPEDLIMMHSAYCMINKKYDLLLQYASGKIY